jgi:hypothetical protein
VAEMPTFARFPRAFPNLMKRLVLWFEPAGGQAVSRQNAWSALVVDVRRRAERVEAERAADAAVAHWQQQKTAV